MVFEVVPKLGYNPMKEYKRESKAQKMRQMSDQYSSRTENQVLADKFKMLKKKINQQKINNNNWIETQHGKKVNYGS